MAREYGNTEALFSRERRFTALCWMRQWPEFDLRPDGEASVFGALTLLASNEHDGFYDVATVDKARTDPRAIAYARQLIHEAREVS